MNLPKTKIAFISILLLIFIIYRISQTEKSTKYFSKKYELQFNDTRKAIGIFPFNSSWIPSYTKNEDILEISFLDIDSLKNYHSKKTINILPAVYFWNPILEEEIDLFKYSLDSIRQINLTTIYSHHLKNGEDPWGLSYYSILENNQIIKNKQVSKVQIDSILNSWRK
ncbi:MAG: hypothetical protein WCK02_00605 [Bacteroidota bacterium]